MKNNFLLWVVVTFCIALTQNSSRAGEKKNVAVIATGGTILEKIDPKTGGAIPALSGADMVKAVPQLAEIAEVKVFKFSDMDSSQMTPEHWLALSRRTDEILADDKYAGAVIMHGTDTMVEGAFFLQLTVQAKKPVVFVGAMRNASQLSADGPANMLNAVRQVCSPAAQDWGVTVSLNQKIYNPRYVIKRDSTNLDTFGGGNSGLLGYIMGNDITRYNKSCYTHKISRPQSLPYVALFESFSGDDGRYIRYAVDSGAKGIVVEGLGAGNINAKAYEAIKYAISKNVAVVITTSCPRGGAYPAYGVKGGGVTLQKAGALLTGDMRGCKARLVLMLALANDSANWKTHTPLFH